MSFPLAIMLLQGLVDPTAAGGDSAPRLANPDAIVSYRDYPKESLRRREVGIVSALIRVSPEGTPVSCAITETSGASALDKTTCSLLLKRGRFNPALDGGERPVAADFRFATSWGIEDRQPKASLAVTLNVSTIPKAYRHPLKVRFVADARGVVVRCDIMDTSESMAADRAACAYVMRQMTVTPPRSVSSAVPAAAVRYVTIDLSTGSPPPGK